MEYAALEPMQSLEQYNQTPNSEVAEKMKSVNKGRDYSIYTWRMDAATQAKVESLLSRFRYIKDGMVIVDAGSGTGKVAEMIAEQCHRMGIRITIIALDLSHEYYDVSSDQPLISLAFGDAAEKNFPDQSIDIKYFSTSGHEVASFGGGPKRMIEAVRNAFTELKPGGQLIIRDFAKPTATEPIYMELPSNDGLEVVADALPETIDYNQLSTLAKFFRFHQEFAGGNAFVYSMVEITGKKLIKLNPEWAYEFYMRKEYTGNWRNEINEKYSYWTLEEAAQVLANSGFTDICVETDPNHYILKNWLVGKIGLYHLDEQGVLVTQEFPATHMIMTGTKPSDEMNNTSLENRFEGTIDFNQLLSSIEVDQERNLITFHPYKQTQAGEVLQRPLQFAITDEPPIIGKKFMVFRLKDQPGKVIKIPYGVVSNGKEYAQKINQCKALYQVVERQHLLETNEVEHLHIEAVDPEGPPYRFVVQQALPENAVCIADLIKNNNLIEEEIKQICQIVNRFEEQKQYQLDTNPFAWYRVVQPDGSTTLTYVSGKVYVYHDDWEFKKIGLLQWIDPAYVSNTSQYFAHLPTKKVQQAFAEQWMNETAYPLWKRYLDKAVQP